MSLFSRLRARRCLDAAAAESLLAGRGAPADAPAPQRALARLLEAAAGPGNEQELAGEVAAAAAFVQVTTQAAPNRGRRRALAAAALAITVAGTTAYAVAVPHTHHRAVPAPFGVPAAHPANASPAPTALQCRSRGQQQAAGRLPSPDSQKTRVPATPPCATGPAAGPGMPSSQGSP
jgi:hypothetical protein